MHAPELDALPVGIVRLDHHERVIAANADFFRWAAGMAVVGRPISEILQPAQDFLEGVGAPSVMMVSTEDPTRAALVTRTEHPHGTILAVLDASDRYQAGLRLRDSHALSDRTRARLELIIDASIEFARVTTEGRLGEVPTSTAASAYRADEAASFLFDDAGTLSRIAGDNPLGDIFSDVSLAAGSHVIAVSDKTQASQISRRVATAMSEGGIEAVLAAPLRSDEATVGLFACFFRRPRQFDREAIPLAEAIAGQAAQALGTMRMQRRLEHAATHDDTTGLPNRRFLEEQVEALKETPQDVSVIFIDLDGFKEINDALGHVVGDRVLREIASRLGATLREEDVIARYGGDEFVVLCNAGLSVATDVAERIRAAVAVPIPFVPALLSPSASIGVASMRLEYAPSRIDRLIRHADQAMYVAKSKGGNQVATARPPEAR